MKLFIAAFTAAIAVATVAVAQTPPDPHAILAEADKVVSEHGVDEARAVDIGGVRQWITVRGKDRRNPILLVIHGGPAAPELPNRYLWEPAWTDYFTVVEWDQRGSGKTFELNDPAAVAPTMTKARMIADAEEMVDYLRKTYAKKKIFVIGHSWGTVLGMELAERKPDALYAYIGAGQIINMTQGETAGYAWVLGQAKAAHNDQAIKELEAIAPYPEANGAIPIDKLGVDRKWEVYFGGLTHGRSTYDVWENAEKISPDYTADDFKAIDKGSAFTLPKLLSDLMAVDFTGVTTLKCPVFIFAGRYDYTTPSEPVKRWFDKVQAPEKKLIWFENSAHMMYVEEPGKVLVHLVQDVRPIAVRAGDAAPE